MENKSFDHRLFALATSGRWKNQRLVDSCLAMLSQIVNKWKTPRFDTLTARMDGEKIEQIPMDIKMTPSAVTSISVPVGSMKSSLPVKA